jgi:hypothetical protein
MQFVNIKYYSIRSGSEKISARFPAADVVSAGSIANKWLVFSGRELQLELHHRCNVRKNVPEADMWLENNLQADRDCAIKHIFIGV